MYSVFQQHECPSSTHIICRMRWDVEQITTVTATYPWIPQPEYPHLQEHTTHTWDFYTLSLALHRNSMYICYLRAACFIGRVWTDQSFTADFPDISAEPSICKLYPPHGKTHSGDLLQAHPAGHIPAAVPLFYPTDRAGFALDCAHKLYRPLHIRMTSSVVTEHCSLPQLEDLGFMSG